MACCGLHRLKFAEVDDDTPDFSEVVLGPFRNCRCQRLLAPKGQAPVKVPICADDVQETNDDGLFDEKVYCIGVCPSHAALLLSEAVEGRACTGEDCAKLDEETGLRVALPNCGAKFVGKRLYCDG